MSQGCQTFEHFAINLIAIDHDTQPVLDFGKESCHGHGVKFGQRAEKARFRHETRCSFATYAKCVHKNGADGPFDCLSVTAHAVALSRPFVPGQVGKAKL